MAIAATYSIHYTKSCVRRVLNQSINFHVIFFLLIQIIHTSQNTSLDQLSPLPHSYLSLILASSGKLRGFISMGYQLSPRASYEYDPDDELDDEVTQALGRVGLNHEYDTAESATSSSTSVEAKSQ